MEPAENRNWNQDSGSILNDSLTAMEHYPMPPSFTSGVKATNSSVSAPNGMSYMSGRGYVTDRESVDVTAIEREFGLDTHAPYIYPMSDAGSLTSMSSSELGRRINETRKDRRLRIIEERRIRILAAFASLRCRLQALGTFLCIGREVAAYRKNS